MTPEAYESAFGHAPDYMTLLCRLEDEAQADAAVARALKSEHVIYTRSSLRRVRWGNRLLYLQELRIWKYGD